MPLIRLFVFCKLRFIEPTSPVRFASVSQSSASSVLLITLTRAIAYRDSPKALKQHATSAQIARKLYINNVNHNSVKFTNKKNMVPVVDFYGNATTRLRRACSSYAATGVAEKSCCCGFPDLSTSCAKKNRRYA